MYVCVYVYIYNIADGYYDYQATCKNVQAQETEKRACPSTLPSGRCSTKSYGIAYDVTRPRGHCRFRAHSCFLELIARRTP